MAYDRKKSTSSFYGNQQQRQQGAGGETEARRSLDALNQDFPEPQIHQPYSYSQQPLRDDASSFFHPADRRGSTDMLTSRPGFGYGPPGSAGYNRGSFFHAGREEPLKGGDDEDEEARIGRARGGPGGRAGGAAEEEVWDVYADFNNVGPRYSSALGGHPEKGYQQIQSMTPKLEVTPNGAISANGDPVEMVTVPALGSEWRREEMHNMKKSARKERKAEARREHFKAWWRDERGICGNYFTRKTLVFFLFAVCAVIATILGITIPRVPPISLNQNTPLLTAGGNWNASVPTYFNRLPANFSFPAYAAVQLDTTSSYLPIKFSSIDASVYDLISLNLVATGHLGSQSVPAKTFPKLNVPLNFTYQATNDSDITWANWYNGCKNAAVYPGGQRPPVQFRLLLNMKILGLLGGHEASAETTDALCPIQLPQDSA